ncbi:MAG: PaaI family thioesterase [Oscillospiraceae bacterium]|nr:PaaI family thioesterase [Oscillospiraceae bacterium]
MKTIEEIREMFSHDRYAAMCGAYIAEVGEKYSKITCRLTEDHRNAVGGVMGAVYFTLADFAFAVATNAYLDKPDIVSVSSSIEFLNYCRGTELTAEAVCIKDGRMTVCYEINVTDDTGRKIALVTIMGCHSGR